MKISATILTKNSARTLEKTLSSLKFLDEIILIDNGSCDNTLAITKKFSKVKNGLSKHLNGRKNDFSN